MWSNLATGGDNVICNQENIQHGQHEHAAPQGVQLPVHLQVGGVHLHAVEHVHQRVAGVTLGVQVVPSLPSENLI